MLIFIGFDRLFCHKRYYINNIALINRLCTVSGKILTLSDEDVGDKYPLDVLFNACAVDNKLICNKKTVSKLILNSALDSKYEIIDVPQGYTRCSVCVISDKAIITADKAIAAACGDSLDVLTIEEGYISLPPYNYGFIGGASGTCGERVFFCGSLDRHVDGERIKKFCESHKKNAVSLSGGELQDVGSLFFIGE